MSTINLPQFLANKIRSAGTALHEAVAKMPDDRIGWHPVIEGNTGRDALDQALECAYLNKWVAQGYRTGQIPKIDWDDNRARPKARRNKADCFVWLESSTKSLPSAIVQRSKFKTDLNLEFAYDTIAVQCFPAININPADLGWGSQPIPSDGQAAFHLQSSPPKGISTCPETPSGYYNRDEPEDNHREAQRRQEKCDFDVFLCHNSLDKSAVMAIDEELRQRGIQPWLDVRELRPGLPFQKGLEAQIRKIKSAAVFVGKRGIGPWQDIEQEAFLRQFIRRGCPVIPVILPDCQKIPKLPLFLEGMMWVDFRKTEPAPLEQLIWGITGVKGF